MTERQLEVAKAVFSAAVTLGYVGILLYIMLPGFRHQVDVGRQWVRYGLWRARWDSLPSWKQEALTVRGRGPA